MTILLKSPYPYFGGKSKVADEIWRRLGDPNVYVEPFLGSGAVWLARPKVNPDSHLERLNDLHAYIPNFWRAMQADPEAVAKWANNPAFECDLHARHLWLVQQKDDLGARLMGDPAYYDAKIAGWWVWGIALWIGGGWCSGRGAWVADPETGRLVRGDGRGIKRQLPHMGDDGRGINRQMASLNAYFEQLQARLHRGVTVTCGDWTRVLKPAVAWGLNKNDPEFTGIVLDPPYTHAGRDKGCYVEDHDIAHEVREWALENGDNRYLRIAYCAYAEPEVDAQMREAGWSAYKWKTQGGYGNNGNGRGKQNRGREVVWFSPHCLKQTQQMGLFDVRIER